jgi:hypothetical protein
MQREFDMLKVSDINVIGLQYKYEIGRKKHKGKSKSNSETQEELPE